MMARDGGRAAATEHEIARARARCRRLVRRRALLSAAVAALPLPGLDAWSELGLLARLIERINREFGLTPGQIAQLRPELRLLAYEAARAAGGALIGRALTRDLLWRLLRGGGVRTAARQAGKLVPLAGQLAAAALGFALFCRIGYQHVEACAAVARRLRAAAP